MRVPRVGAAAAEDKVDQFPELAELAKLLDSRWRIPGTGIRFGADALVGLVPVVGDAATALVAASVVYKAHRLGASRQLVMLMAGNALLDAAVGAIPIAGTVFDVIFRANDRNVALLRRHLESRGKRLPPALPGQSLE